jgi:hypothetical protein
MSTLLEKTCDEIRERLERVAHGLHAVSAGSGVFSDPMEVYAEVRVAATQLEVVQFRIRREVLPP